MKTTDPSVETFIVRVTRDESGAVSGVLERVRTGVKERFDGSDALCRLLTGIVGKERS
jgi:hypothetical protein